MNRTIVTIKELGVNCWAPCRFIKGARCARVDTCTYPEKRTCKAVETEIEYLKEQQAESVSRYQGRIASLEACHKKSLPPD